MSHPSYFSYKVPPPIYGYDTQNILTTQSAGGYRSPLSIIKGQDPEQRERDLLNWLQRTYREGLTTLTSEPAWKHIQRSIDYIYRQKQEEVSSLTSSLSIPQVKHDITEIVATYANVRPIPDFQCPSGADLESQQRILNDLYIDWHITNDADRWYRTGMQNGAVKGTGWLSPRWTKTNLGVSGEGRIVIDNYDHKEVVPIQLGKDRDIQNAYGIHIVNTDTPIARAHAMFPDYQDKLSPDRAVPQAVKKVAKRLGRIGSVALGMFGPSGKIIDDGATSAPCVDIFHSYIKDQAINETGSTMLIGGGAPFYQNNSWAYYVPSYLTTSGDINRVQLERAYQDPKTQQWITDRPITKEECRIYPRGRLIIWTRSVILSDGPNPYWHGRFPVAKICFDEWPDTFLGFPLTLGPIDIEQTCNRLIRCIEDSSLARLNPPMQSDDAVDENLAEKIIPKIPGQKWRINSLLGTGVSFPFPFEFYNVPDFIPKFIDFLYTKSKQILGLEDVQALAMARQTPAADTLQKMMEMMGPIVEDRSRAIEVAIKEIGEQLKSHFFQFYTFEKRVRILGPDGISKEDIDFDPLSLVPDSLPGKTRAEKAILHMKKFKFLVSPRSLHEINSLSRKMLYLQLQRGGFPIDSQTVGEACDIPKLGKIEGDTVFEKFVNEQIEKVRVGIMLQKEQAEAVPSNTNPQLPEGALNALSSLLNGINPNGHPGPGQPSSGQQPPQQVFKDQGTRSTMSESGR
jgi:hypothetical protein